MTSTSAPKTKTTAAKTPAAKTAPAGPQPLPEGFEAPFKRVPMEGRIDDLIACIATLTGTTLAQVTEEAIAVGYPAHGPAFLTESQIATLCMKLGGLVATKYKDFKSFAHLPDVAILYVDWNEDMDIGRHVICHTVHATSERKAFRYLIDPAPWSAPERQLTISLDTVVPDCFIGISKASTTAVKGAKA